MSARPVLRLPNPRHKQVFRIRTVPYTELVLHLLSRTPEGMTSAQLGNELCVTSDGAGRVAQKLYREERITREYGEHSGSQQSFIWKAKQDA